MENKSNANSENETDILVLLDYFKKGFKNVIEGIGLFLKYCLKSILLFLLLIKKNIIFIAICTLLGFSIPFVKDQITTRNFTYELIVSPNYNSTKSLYSLVNSIGSKINNKDSKYSYLKSIEVKPVKHTSELLSSYYGLIGFDSDTNIGSKRDSIMLKQLDYNSYLDNMTEEEFKTHQIVIKSIKPLTQKQIDDLVILPIEKNEIFDRLRNENLKNIDLNLKLNQKGLQKVDTLLSQVRVAHENPSTSISLNADRKNNLEEDLLNQYAKFSSSIVNLSNKKISDEKVLNILANGNQVDIKTVKQNPFILALIGFLASFVIILAIRLWKYLGQYEKSLTK